MVGAINAGASHGVRLQNFVRYRLPGRMAVVRSLALCADASTQPALHAVKHGVLINMLTQQQRNDLASNIRYYMQLQAQVLHEIETTTQPNDIPRLLTRLASHNRDIADLLTWAQQGIAE